LPVSPAVLNLIETTLNGLMTGVMYSLVALGFVLIFKASGIFNFAQGVMALFAALTLVGFQTGQMPFAHLINAIFGTELHSWGPGVPTILAILMAMAVMVLLAFLIERLVLKHLVNQEPIILFMATIGLAYFLEGLGDLMWGADIKPMDVGLPSGGSFWWEDVTREWAAEGSEYYGMYIDTLDVTAALIAIALVLGLSIFSQYTSVGRALRAVADDHQAALSVGISLRTIWVIVWSIAGFVALVAGIMWGAKSGVQFSLSLIALKALPVLILGGFTSIPGAIVGGLIIGVGEKLAEAYVGPMVGGAIENWFAYMLALAFLLFRPQGLFGERIIERI
jgi:branched-chain amino acid transport system permease protein